MTNESGPAWPEGINVVVRVRAANTRDAITIVQEKLGPDFFIESMSGYIQRRNRQYQLVEKNKQK